MGKIKGEIVEVEIKQTKSDKFYAKVSLLDGRIFSVWGPEDIKKIDTWMEQREAEIKYEIEADVWRNKHGFWNGKDITITHPVNIKEEEKIVQNEFYYENNSNIGKTAKNSQQHNIEDVITMINGIEAKFMYFSSTLIRLEAAIRELYKILVLGMNAEGEQIWSGINDISITLNRVDAYLARIYNEKIQDPKNSDKSKKSKK